MRAQNTAFAQVIHAFVKRLVRNRQADGGSAAAASSSPAPPRHEPVRIIARAGRRARSFLAYMSEVEERPRASDDMSEVEVSDDDESDGDDGGARPHGGGGGDWKKGALPNGAPCASPEVYH